VGGVGVISTSKNKSMNTVCIWQSNVLWSTGQYGDKEGRKEKSVHIYMKKQKPTHLTIGIP